jgi:hypothetical protein
MQININKAYQYYIDNINKSCDKRILDIHSFHQAFVYFLSNIDNQSAPYKTNCGKIRFLHIEMILNKIK